MRIIRSNDRELIPSNHEDPRNPGVWKKVLCEKTDFIDGRVQMINWAKFPKGSTFNRHYHEDMQEMFIMLNGPVTVTVNNITDQLNEGDCILIDPLEKHSMTNTTNHDVEYIVIGIASGDKGKTVLA